MNVDYKKLEVIAIHKPDLNKAEIALLKFHDYQEVKKIKDTLFKIASHKDISLEEKRLIDYDISASYETTGYDINETYNYCYASGYKEDYLLYLTGQIIADPRD